MSHLRMERMVRWTLLALAVVLLLNGVVLAAPGVENPRWVIGGGEGERTSSRLLTRATAGQPVASLSTSGPLTMYWGYWGPAPSALYLPISRRK